MTNQLPWVVVDNETDVNGNRPVPGGPPCRTLGWFKTHDQAADWIGQQDPEKVQRGGFGLDGPSEEEA